MKKFNFKEFLMAKGERIGLGICAFLMLILLVSGLSNGFSSPSPEENADKISKLTSDLETRYQNATPTARDKPNPNEDPSKMVLYYATATVRPELYDAPDLIPREQEAFEEKRKQPEIYEPGQILGKAVLVPLRAIRYRADFPNNKRKITKVALIESGGYKSILQKEAGSDSFTGYYQDPTFGLGNGEDAGVSPTPGAPPPSLPGFNGQQGDGKFGVGGGPGPGDYYSGIGGNPNIDTKLNAKLTVKDVLVEDLPQNPNYAERVVPERMIVITSSFPFKKQIEEFAQKLRIEPAQVLAETITVKEDGEEFERPAFEFRWLEVERQVLGSDGHVITDWRRLDYQAQYKELILLTNDTFVDDPDELAAIKARSTNLCLDLPVAWGNKKKPKGDDLYPQLALELPEIKETIEQLANKDDKEVAKPPSSFESRRNPFAPRRRKKQTDPRNPNGTNYPQFPQPGTEGTSNGGGTSTQQPQELILPKHVLIRFVDVQVQPNLHYRYRLRVKMNNPNYGREDTFPDLTKTELLYSPWVEMKGVVSMPQEQFYYAVDQRELDKRKGYTGLDDPNTTATMQIHKWVEAYPGKIAKQEGKDLRPVGEWLVADYVKVHLGEFLGRPHETFVPFKPLEYQSHVLGQQNNDSAGVKRAYLDKLLAQKKIKKSKYNELIVLIEKIVKIPFGDRSLLVDIEGGKRRYVQINRDEDGDETGRNTYEDETARELAFLRPDGRLAVYNDYATRLDDRDVKSNPNNNPNFADEAERRQRREAWHARIKELQEQEKVQSSDQTGQPGDPNFNPFAGGQGAGNDCE